MNEKVNDCDVNVIKKQEQPKLLLPEKRKLFDDIGNSA